MTSDNLFRNSDAEKALRKKKYVENINIIDFHYQYVNDSNN